MNWLELYLIGSALVFLLQASLISNIFIQLYSIILAVIGFYLATRNNFVDENDYIEIPLGEKNGS